MAKPAAAAGIIGGLALPAAAATKSPLEGASKLPETAGNFAMAEDVFESSARPGMAPLVNIRPESSTNLPEMANAIPTREDNVSKITDSLLQLSGKLDEWLKTKSESEASKESAVFSNVNNSKSTVTNFNSYMGAGDEINSSRLQTEQKLFKYRLQY